MSATQLDLSRETSSTFAVSILSVVCILSVPHNIHVIDSMKVLGEVVENIILG